MSLTITGIEKITFEIITPESINNGAKMNFKADLDIKFDGVQYHAVPGDNIWVGTNKNDHLIGGAGNYILAGKQGNDTLVLVFNDVDFAKHDLQTHLYTIFIKLQLLRLC